MVDLIYLCCDGVELLVFDFYWVGEGVVEYEIVLIWNVDWLIYFFVCDVGCWLNVFEFEFEFVWVGGLW